MLEQSIQWSGCGHRRDRLEPRVQQRGLPSPRQRQLAEASRDAKERQVARTVLAEFADSVDAAVGEDGVFAEGGLQDALMDPRAARPGQVRHGQRTAAPDDQAVGGDGRIDCGGRGGVDDQFVGSRGKRAVPVEGLADEDETAAGVRQRQPGGDGEVGGGSQRIDGGVRLQRPRGGVVHDVRFRPGIRRRGFVDEGLHEAVVGEEVAAGGRHHPRWQHAVDSHLRAVGEGDVLPDFEIAGALAKGQDAVAIAAERAERNDVEFRTVRNE